MHESGVAHQDIKEDNLIANSSGEILIIDWDLAQDIFEVISEEFERLKFDDVKLLCKVIDRYFEKILF